MQWLSHLFASMAEPFKWWIVVAPWEGALRVRLGKVAAELGSGLHFRIPFLDRIHRQSLRLRAVADTGQTMRTKDGKNVTISIAVEYGIANLRRMYENLANPELVLLLRVQGIIADAVEKMDSTELTIGLIRAAVIDRLSLSEWGMDRLTVHVTSLAFVRTYRLLTYDYRTLTGLDDAMKGDVLRAK